MTATRFIASILCLLLCASAFAADKKAEQAKAFKPHIWAFSNGVSFGDADKEAATLKELGYDGIGSIPAASLAKRIAAYDKVGLKVFSVYIGLGDKKLPMAIEQLKGRDAIIELTVRQKMGPDTVKAVQDLADLAAKAKLRIALYPHHGFTIAKIDPALELIKKVNRPNVGVMFNLCHYLKGEKAADLEATIERAGDRIFAASSCGADNDGNNWGKLIQPLDVGSFDQNRLFKSLKKIGFKGAVGIQCYAVKGDKKKNLERTMGAWIKIIGKVNQ
jgi:sugar phosphate isomerase/epimerase